MKNILLIWAFVCYLVGFGELKAQQRRTVLLDTSITQPLKYVFKSNFQSPISIANKGLNLHQWLYTNNLNDKQYQVYHIELNKAPFGEKRIYKDFNSVVINLNQKKWESITNPLDLDGVLVSDNKNITFHSSNTSSDDYLLNKQPKLVIDYEVNKSPYGTVWSQQDGNAQHTNRIDWNLGDQRSLEGTDQFALANTLRVFEALKANSSSKYIAAYKNKLIVFYKNETPKPYIAMLNGNKEAWRLPIDELPVSQPIISPEGKMFFVTSSFLIAVDLNEAGRQEPVKKKLSDIKINLTRNQSHVINSIPKEITLGYDGTLYMPITNSTGNFGIIALSAYPSLKPRWFYESTNFVGPVSLSEDEKMVFFIETDIDGVKSRLVVLDNVSGEVLTHSESILSSYANDVNSYIPPVVVQTADKDTTNLYVLNGNKTSNKLYMFKVHYDQFYKANGKNISLAPFRLIESSSNTEQNGISQPTVLNNENVLLIKDGDVLLYNYKTEQFFSHRKDISDWKKGKEDMLQNDATILTQSFNPDFRHHLFFILSSKYLIYKINNQIRSVEVGNEVINAILNQDMSLFIQLSNGSVQHLYFSRDNSAGNKSYTIKKGEEIHKKTYINDKIYIEPMIISENIQTIFAARDGIYLKKGFTVQKGAALTFQIVK